MVTGDAVDAAEFVLDSATGGQFGLCTRTVTPGSSPNAPCSSDAYTVTFDERVESVTTVTVDGVVLAPTAWRFDDHKTLTRVDGGRWPTNTSSWTITAVFGTPVPKVGQMAVGELAAVFADLLLDCGCQLPGSWASLNRDGVTITAKDVALLAATGQIGLDICDMFIRTANPNRLTRPPVARSVDTVGVVR